MLVVSLCIRLRTAFRNPLFYVSLGEYLLADVTNREISRLKSWYVKERINRFRRRKYRILSGEGWIDVIDTLTGVPFWYNEDTGESSYGRPPVIEARHAYRLALERGFSSLSQSILTNIFSFLVPYPDRTSAAAVCAYWYEASKQTALFKRVLAVESGARNPDYGGTLDSNEFISIESAAKTLLPGDTVILCNGHHWETSVTCTVPVKIISESGDPSRCIVELTGSMVFAGNTNRTIMSGITVRRPRKLAQRSVCVFVTGGSTLSLASCCVNNDGALGATVSVARNATLRLYTSVVKGGSVAGVVAMEACVVATHSRIIDNQGCGILAMDSIIVVEDSYLLRNAKEQISAHGFTGLMLSYSEIRGDPSSSDSDPRVSLESDAVSFQTRNCVGDEQFLREIAPYSWKLRHTESASAKRGREDQFFDILTEEADMDACSAHDGYIALEEGEEEVNGPHS